MTNQLTGNTLPHAASYALTEDYLASRFSKPARAAQKIAYEFTTDAGLMHQYCRLREDMFFSAWGLECPAGQKHAFDDQSDVLVARRGLHCIAGGSLTVAEKLLPMEGPDFLLKDMFPTLDLQQGNYGEVSRVAMLPEFSDEAVLPEMIRRLIRRAIARNVKYVFSIAPQPQARSYRLAVQLFGVIMNSYPDIRVPDRAEYDSVQMVVSVMDLSQFISVEKSSVRMLEETA